MSEAVITDPITRPIRARLVYKMGMMAMDGDTGVGGEEWVFWRECHFKYRPLVQENVLVQDRNFRIQRVIHNHVDAPFVFDVDLGFMECGEYPKDEDAYENLHETDRLYMMDLIKEGWKEEGGLYKRIQKEMR